MTMDRRQFAARMGITLLAAGLPAAASAAAPAGPASCADPASLPLSQRSRRRSLGYVEPATDAARRCGLCAFFTGDPAGCGACQMLTGGPVSGLATCNSFAAKQG